MPRNLGWSGFGLKQQPDDEEEDQDDGGDTDHEEDEDVNGEGYSE